MAAQINRSRFGCGSLVIHGKHIVVVQRVGHVSHDLSWQSLTAIRIRVGKD